jgi:hypothetical protein
MFVSFRFEVEVEIFEGDTNVRKTEQYGSKSPTTPAKAPPQHGATHSS